MRDAIRVFTLLFLGVCLGLFIFLSSDLATSGTQAPHNITGYVLVILVSFGAINVAGFGIMYIKLKEVKEQLDESKKDRCQHCKQDKPHE